MATEHYDNFAPTADNYAGDDSAKLFVGGLHWETTTDELQTYFEQFGRVVDVVLKTNHETGLPRGFGFVAFADPASVDRVLEVGTHLIHGKNIDPKRLKQPLALNSSQKIFVGGIDPQMSESSIREYFGQFGTVDELDWPRDRMTNERRRFCFIRFTTNDPVDWLCLRPRHTISGKPVEVKKAVTKIELKTKLVPAGNEIQNLVRPTYTQAPAPLYQHESYSAVYNANAYQSPLRRGLTESYVKHQIYSNQPVRTAAYNADMMQYGYGNGSMPATNSLPIAMSPASNRGGAGASGRGRQSVMRFQPYYR